VIKLAARHDVEIARQRDDQGAVVLGRRKLELWHAVTPTGSGRPGPAGRVEPEPDSRPARSTPTCYSCARPQIPAARGSARSAASRCEVGHEWPTQVASWAVLTTQAHPLRHCVTLLGVPFCFRGGGKRFARQR